MCMGLTLSNLLKTGLVIKLHAAILIYHLEGKPGFNNKGLILFSKIKIIR